MAPVAMLTVPSTTTTVWSRCLCSGATVEMVAAPVMRSSTSGNAKPGSSRA